MQIFNLIKNAEKKSADMIIYGVIGRDTISQDVMQQVRELKNEGFEKLNVFIDSPGGRVSEGMAIYNAIKSMDATTYVYGQAASMASVIALAGKKVVMTPYSHLMVHSPWSFSIGNSKDLREDADVLDKHGDLIVAAYKSRVKATDDEFKAMMDKETWLNAQQAKDLGFCDVIQESYEAENSSRGFVDLIFNLFAEKFNVVKKNIEDGMKLSNETLAVLGLDEKATEQQINDAIVAKAKAAVSISDDVRTMMANMGEEIVALKSELVSLKNAKAEDWKNQVAAEVDAAIAEFKIAASERETRITAILADAKELDKLRAIPKNSVRNGKIETPANGEQKLDFKAKTEDLIVASTQAFKNQGRK